MKIQVEHDEHGAIRAIAIPYEGPGQVAYTALKPRPGYKIAHVEARLETSRANVISKKYGK